MKLTNRMKKILLFLLHPKKATQWFAEKYDSNIPRVAYSEAWAIVSFCEKKFHPNISRSKMVSYKRTFRILERLELVDRTWVINHLHPIYYTAHLELTNKGRNIGKEIEKEIRGLIKEFEYLI